MYQFKNWKLICEKLRKELERTKEMNEVIKEGIKQYFTDLIEKGKQEIDILEANAEIQKIIKGCEETNGWISVDEGTPIDDRYILLSFENFRLPVVGRYEEDEDGGGNFYAGDEDIPLVKQDLFVNAWRELPERYTSE